MAENNEFWREFFQIYKQLPELWKVKSNVYKDRYLKKVAWGKLLEKYKEFDPNASVESVKHKINNIRTCFRRELKKVKKSTKSGTDPDSVYVPTLWYFTELEFLQDHEIQQPGISTMDDEIELFEDEEKENEYDKREEVSSTGNSCQKKRRSVTHHLAEKNAILKDALQQLKRKKDKEESKDDADIYAEAWATSYRKLSTTQQIYAKKAIEGILILGQLNQLTLNAVPTPLSSGDSSRLSTPLSPPSPTHLTRTSTPRFQYSSSLEEYNNHYGSEVIILQPGNQPSTNGKTCEYQTFNELFKDIQYN